MVHVHIQIISLASRRKACIHLLNGIWCKKHVDGEHIFFPNLNDFLSSLDKKIVDRGWQNCRDIFDVELHGGAETLM